MSASKKREGTFSLACPQTSFWCIFLSWSGIGISKRREEERREPLLSLTCSSHTVSCMYYYISFSSMLPSLFSFSSHLHCNRVYSVRNTPYNGHRLAARKESFIPSSISIAGAFERARYFLPSVSIYDSCSKRRQSEIRVLFSCGLFVCSLALSHSR